MKISWPSFKFPAINLWSMPRFKDPFDTPEAKAKWDKIKDPTIYNDGVAEGLEENRKFRERWSK